MRNLRLLRVGLGLSFGLLIAAIASSVQAQEPAPPAPEQPAAPDAAPAAPPAPAPTPPPAPAPAPAPAPPPAYPPPQAYPPAGPPPGYAPYPPPPAAERQSEAGPDPELQFSPGFYIGAALGYGAPLGAQTIFGDEASIAGGVGVMGSAGYQISRNFGLGAFVHWNNAAIEFPEADEEPDDLSSWVLFYGVEARGGFMSKAVDGWASLGLAFGTGSLTFKDESSFCSPEGCFTQTFEQTDDVTFGPMPTIAFGASAKPSPHWGIGPVFRMYVLSVGEACAKLEASSDVPGSTSLDDSECTSDTDEVAIPNVAFAGLEVVFRP
jgi:hypothetical protein